MAGIAENMKSSSDLMRRWASDVSNAFDVSNVVMPDMGVQYSVLKKHQYQFNLRAIDFSNVDSLWPFLFYYLKYQYVGTT